MTANEFLVQAVLRMTPRFETYQDAELFDESFAKAIYDNAYMLTMELAAHGELTENK